MKYLNLLLIVISLVTAAANADDASDSALIKLQQQWAVDNYTLKGDAKEKAFYELLQQADTAVKTYPGDNRLIIWHGIINSTYAGVSGGLSALKYAKIAKADFEHTIANQPEALQGSAYTSLGVLYFKVPGWPIGFGDNDKAEKLLKKALSINPEGIDANYFYGEFLLDDDRYDEAQKYLQQALQAAPRPGRELADSGRKQEIEAALAKLKKQQS
ncbi:tetratricopeptide repeat protein [Shewanella yunxiaonensis]|uniref:Tetratricopeptide repeat protein n=1 Tax=Shewanella yunxiaonensis TaxID=2829809 RepID=A0ABX7YQJ3_9GAMM|nr:tetratricopeptide repeat protein [Shewanella yunxiaonensis]QUN05043.1 tetratricopeptide repeat protein [Shewanella yunxiaonensis]